MAIEELIVTADDLGIAGWISEGIVDTFRKGIVTTSSLLANGGAFDHAVEELLPANPDLPVGAHLNIMFGKSISGYGRRLPILSRSRPTSKASASPANRPS